MTTRTIHSSALQSTAAWSGLDAGRREQVETAVTVLRHFRRGRRGVKRGAGDFSRRIELRGDAGYLRALRSAEMKAWQETGGDWYRPAPAGHVTLNEAPK